ncbi:MAG TPA: hydroxymethylglutaryl-CoA reductase, degradative, partial [Thermoplasmata archaeon]|nr:hydroxymethylglutaryl-CoA reductase, degradative [Thermoplasmata archaeon]
MEEKSSRISGFYKLSVKERLEKVAGFAGLKEDEKKLFLEEGKVVCGVDTETVDRMIENVIGVFELPLGIATNFVINGKDYLIPMAAEESSVVAAASNAARIARVKGGFRASTTDPVMIGQIQLLKIEDMNSAVDAVNREKKKLLEVANAQDKTLVSFGGGARDINVRILGEGSEKMMVLHLLVDVRDAMGANAVNTMCEALAPIVEDITGGEARLKILSNLADKRLAKAEAVFDKDTIGGEKVVDAFL